MALIIPDPGAHPSPHGRFNLWSLVRGDVFTGAGDPSSIFGTNPLFGEPSAERLITLLQSALYRINAMPQPALTRPDPFAWLHRWQIVRLVNNVTWAGILGSQSWPSALAVVRSNLQPRAYLFDPPSMSELTLRLHSTGCLWHVGDHAAQGTVPDGEAADVPPDRAGRGGGEASTRG